MNDPDLIGPAEPPMIRWQRAGEPGFPFRWTPPRLRGEQLELRFDDVPRPEAKVRAERVLEAAE